MARVYSLRELRNQVASLRSVGNQFLSQLRTIEQFRDQRVRDLSISLDDIADDVQAMLTACGNFKDEIEQINTALNLTYNCETTLGLSDAGPQSVNVLTTFSTNNYHTTLIWDGGDVVDQFLVNDQIKITQSENSDHDGIYTVAAIVGTRLDLSTTMKTGTAISVSGITRSSSTATVTTSGAHGYTTGDYVVVSGANQSDYNITAQITVTGSNTFTYTVANSPTTPATGTITAQKAAAVNSADSTMKVILYAR